MKKVICLVIAFMMTVMLWGCSAPAPAASGESSDDISSSSTASKQEVSSEAAGSQASSESRSTSYGSDLLGYVTLQGRWSMNMDCFGETDTVQYLQENNSITLKVFKDATMTPKEFAESLNKIMVRDGAVDIATEKVTLAGFDAYLTHGSYSNQNAEYNWFFETGNGNVNCVGAQAMESDIDSVKAMAESSYTISAGKPSTENSGSESKITTQRVGSDKAGYVNIPDDWSLNTSDDLAPGMLVYASKDGSAKMSLSSADLAAENYIDSGMASLGLSGETRASTLKIGGYAAMRFTLLKGQDVMVDQWLISTGGTNTSAIVLMAADDQLENLTRLIEESFSMKK